LTLRLQATYVRAMAAKLERLRDLRDEYEAALDGAARLRDQYHREIVKLHRSGLSLREIAEALGISHQRVHQIISPPEEEAKRPRRKVTGAVVASAIIVCLLAGGGVLFVANREPELPTASPIAPSAEPGTELLKEQACKRFRALFESQGAVTQNVDCRDVTFMSRVSADALLDLNREERDAVGDYLTELSRPHMKPS
jgi:hypothetical protein